MKKRLLSLLLAVVMVVGMIPTSVLTAFAEEEPGTASANPSIDYFGELVVNINNIISTRETVFKVELFNQQPDSAAGDESGEEDTPSEEAEPAAEPDYYSMEMTSEAGAASVSGFIMGSEQGTNGIAPGTYTLKISAKGYATYTQELTFKDDDRITITLYNSRGVNDGRDQSQWFGVIPYGDVTGDGVINKDDSDAIIRKMNGERAVEVDFDVDDEDIVIPIEDLNLSDYRDENGNAIVDLEDLTICVRNQGEDPMLAKVEHGASAIATIVRAKASAEATTGTLQAHSSTLGENISAAAALLSPSEDSYVELGPADPEADISEDNPVEFAMSFEEIAASEDPANPENPENPETPAPQPMQKEGIFIASKEGNPVTSGAVEVEDAEGKRYIVPFEQGKLSQGEVVTTPEPQKMRAARSKAPLMTLSEREPSGSVDSKGNVSIDLGTMVAIKKITIKITGSSTATLAEIAKVEFLDDFASRLPEPVLNIPTKVEADYTEVDGLGYRTVNVDWNKEDNVTGYEVNISGPGFNKSTNVSANTETNADGRVRASFIGDSFNGTVSSPNSYKVKVRSTSGDWKSPWSEESTFTVVATKAPPTPESSKVISGDRMLTYTWVNKWDTEGATVYYRKMAEGETADSLQKRYPDRKSLETAVENEIYQKADVTNGSSFPLNNLGVDEMYDFAVAAYNTYVDTAGNTVRRYSGATSHSTGKPTSSEIYTKMPAYKMINVQSGTGRYDKHIQNVDYGAKFNQNQYWVYSDGPDGKNIDWDPWAMFDDKASSYLKRNQWANGTFTVWLDTPIEMNKARIAYVKPGGDWHYAIYVTYTNTTDPANIKKITIDKDGKETKEYNYYSVGASFTTKTVDGNKYYEITLNQPVEADRISFCLVDPGYDGSNTRFQELRLYYYDSVEDETNALFEDDMHTKLNSSVTKGTIQNLQSRLEVRDPVSKELNPNYTTIKADLDYALQLLTDTPNLAPIIEVDNTITSNADSGLNAFSQSLSPYQPLGYVAAQNDTIVVYVTRDKLKRGTNANLQLIATQYHPEYGSWKTSAYQLKCGRNEIQIPGIVTTSAEHGGSLYLRYTGNKGAEDYKVRVSGATEIPMLNVKGVGDVAERKERIKAYIQELQTHVDKLRTEHETKHEHGTEPNLKYSYDPKKCILNATEISMNNMFYSVAADQILSGLGSGDIDQKVDNLYKAIEGMEQAIDYYYQFKGLNKYEPADSKDRYPSQRLNIRFHGMFTGAFMYAASEHIGIEYGSVSGLSTIKPAAVDADGKVTYDGATWGGWGIAHEIGHCINTSGYQRVEVTNNVFAQLEKAITKGETNAEFRTSYNNVYKGVVAGNVGHTGNLAVQLAMYWQLHLAYDDNPTAKLYDTAAKAQENLIYAKIDAIYRDHSKGYATREVQNAEGEDTVERVLMTWGNDADQNFMRVVCTAANKDVLDFFRAWGFKPDATTAAYASLFEKEARSIQYIDDNSHLFRVEKPNAKIEPATVTAKFDSAMNVVDHRTTATKIQININDNKNSNVLGYEIQRNGKVVGFVVRDEDGDTQYTDILNTENNKAFKYTVTPLDKLLNPWKTVELDEIKVCNVPTLDKSTWKISTNIVSPSAYKVHATEDTIHAEDRDADLLSALIDGKNDTIFYGAGSGGRPYVTIDLSAVEQVAALKLHPVEGTGSSYTNPLPTSGEEAKDYDGVTFTNTASGLDISACRPFGYKIEVSTDGTTWTVAKTGDIYGAGAAANNPSTWNLAEDAVLGKDGDITLYFNKQGDPSLYTYDARYIRFTSTSMGVMSLAEIDIIGPTGDNIELEKWGTLSEDFTYNEAQPPIPAGSYVFYGEYKGDPGYSAVVLRDHNNVILGGEQVIFANVPEKGQLGNTSQGKWLFWMEDKVDPDSITDANPQGIKYKDQMNAVTVIQAELYRVNNAHTLEGQRLTSNTLHLPITKATMDDTPVKITSDVIKQPGTSTDEQSTRGPVRARARAPQVEDIPCINSTELAEALAINLNDADAEVQTFAESAPAPYSGAMAASDPEPDDDESAESDEGQNGNESKPNSYNPFTLIAPKLSNNEMLADKGADVTVHVRPVNSAFAMEVIITFERSDVLERDASTCCIKEESTIQDGEDIFTGEYVNAAKGEIRLYAVSRTGSIDNKDLFVGTLSLPALETLENLTDVNYSVVIHEVNSDNQLVATIDEDGNRTVTNVYEGEDYIEYDHTLVPVEVAVPTCTGTSNLDVVCAHNNKEDHNYTGEKSFTVDKIDHAYVSIGGVMQCSTCHELLGKDEMVEWHGDWYWNGVKQKNGVVSTGSDEGKKQLFVNNELVTKPGLYAVKAHTVMVDEVKVPVYYPVLVLENGYLATGDGVVAVDDYTLTYVVEDKGSVREEKLTLKKGYTYVFSADGEYVGEDPDGMTPEQLASETAASNLKNAAANKFNETSEKIDVTVPAASKLAGFKVTKKGSLPSGITFQGTTVTAHRDVNGEIDGITVTHTFKAKSAAYATKYLKGMTITSTTTGKVSKTYYFNAPTSFEKTLTASVNSGAWTIQYSLLTWAYDTLYSSKNTTDITLAACIYERFMKQ